MKHIKTLAFLTSFTLSMAATVQAQDRIRVVTTTETLRSIAEEVGGDRVEVTSLSRANQDPHFVVPTPTLMVQANRADLFVEMGLGLEIWAEPVLDGARNAKIRRGAAGHVIAGNRLNVLERPQRITRADGDIHPAGNPHVWLDPLNGITLAENVADGLERIDPAGGEEYQRNLQRFRSRIFESYFGQDLIDLLGVDYLLRLQKSGGLIDFLEATEWEGSPLISRLGGWREKLRSIRGASLVSYHRTWPYLGQAFDLDFVEQLEPKPGISPTPAHLGHVRKLIESEGVRAILCTPYFDFYKARSVAAEAGIRAVEIPTEVGADPKATDYFRLFDRIVEILGEATG